MKDLYEKYLKINEDIKALEQEKNNLKAEIKLKLEILEADNWEDNKVIISNKESIRITYPTKILKEMLNAEQLETAKTETSYSTLRVVLKE